MSDCECQETSYFRERGLVPPLRHDCDYVRERNNVMLKLIRTVGVSSFLPLMDDTWRRHVETKTNGTHHESGKTSSATNQPKPSKVLP